MAPVASSSAASVARPARSRSSTIVHRNAESTIASIDSSAASAAGGCAGSAPSVSQHPDRPAAESGQPSSRPLWLNSQGPWPNGAAACSPGAVPGVAERTAASTAVEVVTRATSGSDGSPQIGTPRRYRAGTGSPPAYQPMPNPSAFTVPYRCRRGAHDCRYSECGGSISSDRSDAGGPR